MKNLKSIGLIGSLAAVVAAGAFTGCSSWSHDRHNERTVGRAIDDKNISAKVKADLAAAPVYKFGDVDVKTFNGIVQLSGFVNTDAQKNRAGEIAQHVEGVSQVVNNIVLKEGLPTPTGRLDNNPNNYPNRDNLDRDNQNRLRNTNP